MSQLISVVRPEGIADKEMVAKHGHLWLIVRRLALHDMVEARSIATGERGVWLNVEFDNAEPA
jgi:hypothetical protein